jgi:hypothetical protein
MLLCFPCSQMELPPHLFTYVYLCLPCSHGTTTTLCQEIFVYHVHRCNYHHILYIGLFLLLCCTQMKPPRTCYIWILFYYVHEWNHRHILHWILILYDGKLNHPAFFTSASSLCSQIELPAYFTAASYFIMFAN